MGGEGKGLERGGRLKSYEKNSRGGEGRVSSYENRAGKGRESRT